MTTLQNLSRILDDNTQLIAPEELTQFLNRVFFCPWTFGRKLTTTQCCFNHMIGLPQKNGKEYPLFPYEQTIFSLLETDDPTNIKNKHLWIKKATGLGITEFTLRYIAYLCLRDNALANSTMCIVTGPNISLAENLILRLKKLFTDSDLLTLEGKSTSVTLNNVVITAYPSHHLDSMRGIKNVSLIFLDESDFFPIGQQQDARDISERYIGKSNPYIIMASTPNAPLGLAETIEKEPESACLYHRLQLDYTHGLNKIYTEEEIRKARASPSFQREYNLAYLGSMGNIFHTTDIDFITKERYNPLEYNPLTPVYIGVDVGFGSSDTAIVAVRYNDFKLEVIHAETISKGLYEDILRKIIELIEINNTKKVFVDGSAVHLIRSLKNQYHEYPRWDILEKNKPGLLETWQTSEEPRIVPVNFAKEHRTMLKRLMLCISEHTIRIDKRYDKLITGLRSATAKDDNYSLNKEQTSYNDLVDGLRLSITACRFTGE